MDLVIFNLKLSEYTLINLNAKKIQIKNSVHLHDTDKALQIQPVAGLVNISITFIQMKYIPHFSALQFS